MKIQCDVCEKEEASVFCSADEAALCRCCDRRVHHANKLAGKHLRFSLLHPSFKDSPRCDICQERRGFIFCQEDRAILRRECDIPIHKANELTQKHNRFLLSCVKLSPILSSHHSSSSYQTSSSESNVAVTETEAAEIKSTLSNERCLSQEGASASTSSISKYLMETIPGWHVEDFPDPPPSPYGFCKFYNHMLPFTDNDIASTLGSFSSQDLAILVPQFPAQSHHSDSNGSTMMSERESIFKKDRNGVRVPQANPPYTKR